MTDVLDNLLLHTEQRVDFSLRKNVALNREWADIKTQLGIGGYYGSVGSVVVIIIVWVDCCEINYNDQGVSAAEGRRSLRDINMRQGRGM